MIPQEYFHRKITFTNIAYDTTGCTKAEIAEANREGDFLPTMSIKVEDFLAQYGDMDTRAEWMCKNTPEEQDFDNLPYDIELELLADDIYFRAADFISDRTGWLVEDFNYTID